MWARLGKPRHQAWLTAKPLVESVLLDSEPPAGLVRRVVLARYKEPPEHPCQQQTEQILLDSAHLPSSPLTFVRSCNLRPTVSAYEYCASP